MHCDIKRQDNQQCDARTQQLRYCVHCVDAEKMDSRWNSAAVYCALRGAMPSVLVPNEDMFLILPFLFPPPSKYRNNRMDGKHGNRLHLISDHFFVLSPPNLLHLHLLAIYTHKNFTMVLLLQ